MLTRRAFGACALCSAIGLAAGAAEAEQPAGFTRTILRRTEFPGDRYVTVLVRVEIAPNTLIARHTHPGVETSYILDGEGVLMVQGQPDQTMKTGDGFQVPAGVPHSLQNGAATTRVVATYVVEKDKPLASPA
ncbi:MAG: cupin domain-containing protein [Rhodospirillales bacterium]|nr:cupin domain-containing protein [Rhodospirillales bacterium]